MIDPRRLRHDQRGAVRRARVVALASRLAHPAAPNGERYLTHLAAMAHEEGNAAVAVEAADPVEVRGINDRIQLAEAEARCATASAGAHMLAGVTIVDPPSTFIDAGGDDRRRHDDRTEHAPRGATSIGARVHDRPRIDRAGLVASATNARSASR